MKPATDFDSFAHTYDAELDQALLLSGEGKDYFAQARVAWLARCLRILAEEPQSVMDYGCGIGGTAVLLHDLLGVKSVLALDVSVRSLEVAKSRYGADGVRFLSFEEYSPQEEIDVVYCNGVFHHIPVERRAEIVHYILRSLRPGGLFALWENSPWNPGARFVMSRCAFDRDALTLTPPGAARLLRAGGFQVLHTDFLFIFPRALRFLRFLEPQLSRLPLGAQYMVLCRKPAS
jgi:SAM-dependent methyltransferase